MTAIPDLLLRDSMTDAEIVRRVTEGETSLFELIMRRYNQRIYRAVRAIVRDESEAEDVMQQAYVNAYLHLAQFAERSSFATWLTRIAINEALARVRPRALRAVDDVDGTIMDELQSNTPNPEEAAVASEIKEVVEREIAALPESYRSVLMFREIEGLSTAETAECLGTTEDVVKTRLHRARTMLRDNIYKRAGLAFNGLFTFGQSRCDRVVASVMERIR
jgi:RNA polymerase sigma-70 factor (ECF subfamily)